MKRNNKNFISVIQFADILARDMIDVATELQKQESIDELQDLALLAATSDLTTSTSTTTISMILFDKIYDTYKEFFTKKNNYIVFDAVKLI